MRITAVGFDVGIRNLGMAIVTRIVNGRDIGMARFECRKLELIDLNTNVTNEAVQTLHEKLNDQWELLKECKYVNIEQQPEHHHMTPGRRSAYKKDNTQMKSISHAIQGWFLARGAQVEFVSPKSKMTIYDGPPIDLKSKSKDAYYLRKKLAVEHAKGVLMVDLTSNWIPFIDNLEKKDDVCDAYLQCCYALDRHAKKIPNFIDFS